MAVIESFRDLDVYKLALEQTDAVFETAKSFPPDERYGMTAQVRRSSGGVGPLIAEAWARRPYRKAFVNTLNQAKGEVYETQAWLDQALRRGYITPDCHTDLDHSWQRVGAMLQSMIRRADKFIQPPP